MFAYVSGVVLWKALSAWLSIIALSPFFFSSTGCLVECEALRFLLGVAIVVDGCRCEFNPIRSATGVSATTKTIGPNLEKYCRALCPLLNEVTPTEPLNPTQIGIVQLPNDMSLVYNYIANLSLGAVNTVHSTSISASADNTLAGFDPNAQPIASSKQEL